MSEALLYSTALVVLEKKKQTDKLLSIEFRLGKWVTSISTPNEDKIEILKCETLQEALEFLVERL